MPFAWKTGETGRGEEPESAMAMQAAGDLPRSRGLPAPQYLLLAAICNNFVGLRLLDQRVDLVEARAEAETKANFRLLRQAANSGDIDLLPPLVSAADDGWYALQEAKLRRNILLDRSPIGLNLRAAFEAEPMMAEALVTGNQV